MSKINLSYYETNFENQDDLLAILCRKNEIDSEEKAARFYGRQATTTGENLVAFKCLVGYCKLTYAAMTARELGLIANAAEELEKDAELIYNSLPKFSRW